MQGRREQDWSVDELRPGEFYFSKAGGNANHDTENRYL